MAKHITLSLRGAQICSLQDTGCLLRDTQGNISPPADGNSALDNPTIFSPQPSLEPAPRPQPKLLDSHRPNGGEGLQAADNRVSPRAEDRRKSWSIPPRSIANSVD